MKRLFAAALIAASIITSAFASSGIKANLPVNKDSQANFPHVTGIDSTGEADYGKANFVLDNVTMTFYKLNGDFIGTSRAITPDYLPIAVKRSFSKEYGNYEVREAIKFETREETAYFVSAQKEKQFVIFKVKDDEISLYKINITY